MTRPTELGDIARAIIDANVYMTLGTADEHGNPWVSPVFYAARDYREFFWISSPEATQCRNIAKRPQVSLVIFDSRVPVGQGQAVYMSAVAEQVPDAEIDRALEIYPGPPERGARRIHGEDVRPPGRFRLYRAAVTQHSVLCPLSSAQRCPDHGRVSDHRALVTL
ncbi:MAG TPA: pyridoxamine 5'-phosphate oxidase family protein [Streptosporangiaceae bacterium]